MKIAVIGSSGHKNYVFETLDRQSEIVAYAPGVEGEEVSYEKGRAYGNWKTLIDEVRPEMVVNNTWYGSAAPVTLYALKKGCHVFAEKPLSGTEEELAQIDKAWKESSVYLGGMFGISYESPLHTVNEYLKSHDLGDIRIINTQKSYKLGKRADFCKDRDTYTGTIPWVGAHGIDWIYRYGKKQFRTVTAFHSAVGNGGNGSLESIAVCAFKLEGEALATLTIDYLRPGAAETHGDDRTRIVGTKGIIEAQGGKVTVVDDQGTRELPLLEAPLIFPEFLKDIRAGKGREEWAHHALYVTEICLKTRLAADREESLTL
ncbi:MAG: Gfo/Idh/MocA family oxidoreductase [Spirochaetales bacterium]|nr:Gfo/Idh/MocA family oxidoreductase [Spirochaetales bacterium]